MRRGWEEYAVLIGFVSLVSILAIAESVIWFLLSTHRVLPPRLDRHAARAELPFTRHGLTYIGNTEAG